MDLIYPAHGSALSIIASLNFCWVGYGTLSFIQKQTGVGYVAPLLHQNNLRLGM